MEAELIFNYKDVIGALALKHGISEKGMTGFKGRFIRFQTFNFPKGVKTGRGKPAAYGWNEVIQLGLAVECLQLGIAPQRAIEIVESDFEILIKAIAGYVHNDDQIGYYVIRSNGFAKLRKKGNLSHMSEVPLYLEREGGDALLKDGATISIIYLGHFLQNLYTAFADTTQLTKDELSDSFKSWAREIAQ